MKKEIYYHGQPGQKYGIWNAMAKCWQFGICEDTPMLAAALPLSEDRRRCQKITLRAPPPPRQDAPQHQGGLLLCGLRCWSMSDPTFRSSPARHHPPGGGGI
ncbi:MAG: hypothetical protein ACLSAF_15520 [Intestinimonas sp.]